MTSIVPTPMSRFALLTKSTGDFKHSGKYYLLNGRWHKLHADKPAPKDVPIVRSKPESGEAKMTDEMWGKVFAHPDNTNKGVFVKKLEKLKAAYEAGDVNAILSGSYPNDTTNKKVVKVANYLLHLMGSDHKVEPGLKAGTHAALGQSTPEHHEQANQAAQKEADKDVTAEAKPKIGPVGQALKEAIAKPSAPEPVPPEPVAATPEAPVSAFAMPAFIEGKKTSGVVAYYEEQAQKVIDMAAASDVDGLVKMKHYGSKPNAKGKISNTWAGKTANSKMLIALHDDVTTALNAYKPVGDMPVATFPASLPKPVMPELTGHLALAGLVQSAIDANDQTTLLDVIDQSDLSPPDTNLGKVHTYAKEALAYLGGELPKPDEPVQQATAKSPAAELDHLMSLAGSASDASMEASTYMVDHHDDPEMYENIVAALKKYGFTELAEKYQKFKDKTDKTPRAAKEEPAPTPAAAPPSAEMLGLALSYAADAGAAMKAAANYITAHGNTSDAYVDAIAALKHAGYNGGASALQVGLNDMQPGPKEGDTKEGADGMLVLKDGHWVKVEQPAPVAKKLKASEAIALGKGFKTASGMKATLKGYAVAGDLLALQQFADTHSSLPASCAYAKKLIAAMTDGKPSTAAAPKVKAKPAPAPAPNATTIPFGTEVIDGWQQTGPQGGSNPGGKFKDADGVEWYCKFPGNDDVAKSEVLAAKLYAAAGIAGQDAKLISKDGKLGIASKWTDVSKTTPAKLAKADGVAAGFAVDAWLGNWDVVGLGYDNLQLGPDGKAMRVDAGGSLEYRAQGGKKAFGDSVIEIDSLRDKSINPQSAAVFGKLSQADITASVSKVLSVSDSKIYALVHGFGPGDAAAKQKMIDTLIARKADLAAKYPKAKKEKKVKPFKPEGISAPPSFMNWGGSGKSGPSSKEFLNAANESAVQAIYAAAQTGSLDAVNELSASVYNKDSGEITGSAHVLEHPSQHVKGYAQQAINEINYQLNPPKRFRFEGGHPLNSLHSAYPSHKGPLHGVVAKVGKYILLGEPGTISLDSLALPKHTYQSGAITQATFSPAAKASIASMPETQKQAIKAYTGSSYHSMNQSLWAGNPSGAAKSAGEALHALGHDITPGTVLSRKISVGGSDLDEILKSAGKILQEPAIMSTSIRPSSWSGNVQLKMHVGPGVKGLWVGKGSVGSNGALSNHSGEDELILPPNTRLLILSVKKTSGPDADGFGNGVGHVIEAVILPTQAS